MLAIVQPLPDGARVWAPAPAWRGKVRVRYDDSGEVLRRGGRVHGPATARFSVPVTVRDRWRRWTAQRDVEHGKPQAVVVPAGKTLRVRP